MGKTDTRQTGCATACPAVQVGVTQAAKAASAAVVISAADISDT